jgi:hypothetical protein
VMLIIQMIGMTEPVAGMTNLVGPLRVWEAGPTGLNILEGRVDL